VVVGLVALLFFTSDAGPRAVIVNDTGTRIHVFYCTDSPCLRGDGATDQVLEPGDAATDFWDSPDVSGRIGFATVPGERLIGCLSDPHPGQDVLRPYAVLASTLRPCPGQTRGVRPLVSMNNQ
jgi:hypothetical protein